MVRPRRFIDSSVLAVVSRAYDIASIPAAKAAAAMGDGCVNPDRSICARRVVWNLLLVGALLMAVRVDATTTNFDIAAGTDDGRVNRDSVAPYPPSGAVSLQTIGATMNADKDFLVANSHFMIRDMLMRWDTSSLGSGVVITGVNLLVRVTALSNDDTRNFVCDWLPDAALATTDYAENVGTTALNVPLATGVTNGANNTFALSGFNGSPGVNKTGFTKLRCGISGGQPTGVNDLQVATFENAEGLQVPELQVTFLVLTPTPTLTPTSTPTRTPTQTPTSTARVAPAIGAPSSPGFVLVALALAAAGIVSVTARRRRAIQ